jgi:hypothetical protein
VGGSGRRNRVGIVVGKSSGLYGKCEKTVSECKFLVWDHGTIRRLAKAHPQLAENGLRLALHYLERPFEVGSECHPELYRKEHP